MAKLMSKSPEAVLKKEKIGGSYRLENEGPSQVERSRIGGPVVQKGGIRRNVSSHANSVEVRVKMTVPVSESFKEIQKMNDKALKLIARRG